jgi:hypothetical protein
MEQEKPKNPNPGETSEKQKPAEEKWVDTRTFFEKYTLSNIIAEIRSRLSGK